MWFWLRLLRYPLLIVFIIIVVVIYKTLVQYPGQVSVKTYPGSQQVGYAQQGKDDALNTQYEIVYWTNDPLENVTSYFEQFAIELDRPNQTDYHLTYFADPSDYDKFESEIRQEIKTLAACRTKSSLQKLEGCYSLLVIDLAKTPVWPGSDSLPDWLTPEMLPHSVSGTLMYEQWWTAKSY